MIGPEGIKIWVDLATAILTILGVLIAGIAAYGILLLSSRPEILIDTIAFWPPSVVKGINSKVLSAQIRLLNPAMGSQVTSVFEIQSIDLELSTKEGSMWHFRPYAFLKPLVIKDIGEKNQFTAEVEELYHPLIMIGHGQQVVHVAFISKETFSLTNEYLKIHLKMNYRNYNPLFVPFRNPKLEPIERTITEKISTDYLECLFERKICLLCDSSQTA